MKFEVLSLQMAEDLNYFARTVCGENCLVISITDSGFADIPIFFPEDRILRLQFEDVERESKRTNYLLFTEEHAHIILESVTTCLENEDITKIIVHCHAGISRSPAVAAALCFILNGNDDNLIKRYPLFNRRVYATIINEFQTNKEFEYLNDYYWNKRIKQ